MERFRLNVKHSNRGDKTLDTLSTRELEEICANAAIDVKRRGLSETLYRSILLKRLRKTRLSNIGLETKRSCKSIKRLYGYTTPVTNIIVADCTKN